MADSGHDVADGDDNVAAAAAATAADGDDDDDDQEQTKKVHSANAQFICSRHPFLCRCIPADSCQTKRAMFRRNRCSEGFGGYNVGVVDSRARARSNQEKIAASAAGNNSS
jgi:hypothetical protein